jgi:hypothetical protein
MNDLLGRRITKPRSRLAMSLAKYDRDCFDDRLERLRWLQQVLPSGYSYVMPPETAYIFGEIKNVFVDGAFIATILLSAAFIEHWLSSLARSKGFEREAARGLSATIKCLRREGLVHDYLLEKADALRKLRNPFVHLQAFENPDRVTQRAILEGKHPIVILEESAKQAVSLMCTIAVKVR